LVRDHREPPLLGHHRARKIPASGLRSAPPGTPASVPVFRLRRHTGLPKDSVLSLVLHKQPPRRGGKHPIACMKDFAAIDFETANGKRTSVCSVGIVVVRGGTVCEEAYRLIRPRPNYYSEFCTRIHGLTYQ